MPQKSFEIESFYDLALPEAVAVSPDGTRVVVTIDRFDPQNDERLSALYVAPADGSQPPHLLTHASTASSPKWSPDGSRVAFLAEREADLERRIGQAAENGDSPENDPSTASDQGTATSENDEPETQVWVFNMERGGDARQVTDRSEGVTEFDWSPSGDRLVITSRDPTDEQAEMLEERRNGGPIEIDRLQHKADGVGWLDEVKTCLFVVDLDGDEVRRLDEAYGAGALEHLFGMQPTWDEGGIAFVTNRTEWPDNSWVMHLFVVDPDDSNPTLEQVTDGDMLVRSPEWAPSADRIAFIGGPSRNWYRPTKVYIADLERGTIDSRTADLDRTVPFGAGPHWLDNDTLVCPVGEEGWTRLVRVSTDSGPERILDGLGRDRTLEHVDVGGDTLSVTVSDPQGGHEVFSISVEDIDGGSGESDTFTQLSHLNEPIVEEYVMPAVRRVEYENADGDTIEGIVYYPTEVDLAEASLPLLVSLHGGPMSYDEPEFDVENAFFVGEGYLVFQPNYRGSTSYGGAFAEQLRGTRGVLETEDVESGVEHLEELGWIDPDRTFIQGFSYGGIATSHVLTSVDSFVAGVAEHGIYDYYSNFGTDDAHLWAEDEFGLPWEEPETYREISSITDVDEIDTPLLITAGENDWRCPPTQAEQLHLSLRKVGVETKLVVYQDERHSITDPDRAIHRLETIAEWFEEHDPGR